ncbi:MAG: hypothetical protein R3D70_16595 [Rhizobiaceae bacterium]
MTDKPEPSVANEYLRNILDRYDESRPPAATAIAAMRKQFHELLDTELKSAATKGRKKRLKALGVGGTHAFDSMSGTRSDTVLETFNDLVDIATGVRARDGLAREQPRTKQRTASEDWQIAAAIVALRRASSVSPDFEKRILASTGINVKQIKKLFDNLEQGQGSYEGVRINMQEIERRLSDGEKWMLEHLVQ